MNIIRKAMLKLPTLTLRRDMGKVLQLATSEAFEAGCDHARGEQRAFLMRHPELREHYLRCATQDVQSEVSASPVYCLCGAFFSGRPHAAHCPKYTGAECATEDVQSENAR